MTDRDAAIDRFLGVHGWGAAVRSPLAGDASFRRYERLRQGEKAAILMDAPPPMEDVRPFVRVARHLRALDLCAPEIYAVDEAAGLLLIEDLGDDRFTVMLNGNGNGSGNGDEDTLYQGAVDVLIELHRHPAPGDLADYDAARLLEEVERVLDWFMPAFAGAAVADAMRDDYRARWRAVLDVADGLPKVTVLMDYHVDNLMWLPERQGLRRVGLLDFQDALAGSPAYDLVSLLQDARRDVSEPLVDRMLKRYIEATGFDENEVRTAYAVLGAQRGARLVGQFPRLWIRDGKPQYLEFMPRIWRLLTMDLTHPSLAPVAEWFDAHVPPERRGERLPGAPS